jgi:O-antigen ligase
MPSWARALRIAEWAFVVLGLFWLSEGHATWRRALRDRDFGHALLVLSVLLLIRHRRELRALLAASWPVLLVVLLAALSPLWSLDAQRSVRAAVSLAAASAFGLWIALRFSRAEQHQLVAVVLALLTAVSALLAIAAPEIGTMQEVHVGAWQGLFRHKNALAAKLSLAVPACGLLALALPRARPWAGGSAVLALAMLVPARSVGGSAALLLTTLPVVLVAWLRRLARPTRERALLVAGALLALVIALALVDAERLLGLVGRDLTLTRRTEIWTLLWPSLRERPWLGHGAGSYWQEAPASFAVERALGFEPGSAHNGLYDLALELGAAGVIAFLVPWGTALVRATRLALAERGAASLWPLAFLVWLVASNLPESRLAREGKFAWALYIATAATLAVQRGARARR